jgi:pimeloyl-ACP methyl ester carboxylesterase
MSHLNQQFRLPGGRRLGYDLHGPPGGRPLFYFHGSPSARVEFSLFSDEETLNALNIQVIAVDRPGMGLSDFQANRALLNWPNDVLVLADHLQINQFSILAYSLGGPYGFACARAITQRLVRVGIVSGSAFFNIPELVVHVNEGTRRYLNLPRANPWAARFFLWMLGATARYAPGRLVAQAKSMLPEPDSRIVLGNTVFQQGFIRMVREAFCQGVRGPYQEALIPISDWGFEIEEIQKPVLLWHGESDQNIPVEMARYAAERCPNIQAAFYPNEGHLSLFKKYAPEIFTAMVE